MSSEEDVRQMDEVKLAEEGGGGGGGGGEGGSGETKELYHPRRNGWNCPWHPLQILAWAFILFFTVFYFGFLIFYIPGAWSSIGYTVAGVLFAVHISATLVTATMDPAEASVRRRRTDRMGGLLRSVFDRKKHKHVIENHYCNICEVNVTSSAKHCRVCDKCVGNFDHHCIWLNTCIGARNYRWFLVTVFSALLACILLLIYTLCLFVTFFSAREGIRYACSDHFFSANSSCDESIRLFGAEVPDPVFPTLVAVISLLAAVGVVMIGYLASFHIYLIAKGLTTYDYIVLQRNKEKEREEREERERRAAQEAGEEQGGGGGGGGEMEERDHHGRCWCLRRKVNRINPGGLERGQRSKDTELAGLETSSISSAGLLQFGRTPTQSIMDSQTSTSSDSNSVNQCSTEMNTLDWAYGTSATNAAQTNNNKKEDSENSHEREERVELEALSRQADYSTVAVRVSDTAASVETTVVSVRSGDFGNQSSCSGSPATGSAYRVESCDTRLSSIDSGSDHEQQQHLDNYGTLAFMSSANSIPSEILATQEDSAARVPSAGASGLSVGVRGMEIEYSLDLEYIDRDVTNLITTEETVYSCGGGGIAPLTSTESNKLREERHELLLMSGNTVGLRALRQLSSSTPRGPSSSSSSSSSVLCEQNATTSTTAMGGSTLNNMPLLMHGQLQLSHLPQQPFPLPVQVSLTAQPRFPVTLSDQQDVSVLSTPALV